ncbi:MAG: DUF177 domain-containing protein [Afipia sp.]|nr:DUF177 domain-containing protein [Afipia sp.]
MISTPHPSSPWSLIVAVAQIPDAGLHEELTANATQSIELAVLAGVRDIKNAHAALDVTPVAGDRVHVTGRVTAIVGQTCVVTLDPIDNVVDEAVDVMFAPASQIPVTAKVVTKEEGEDADIPDPPEPILNGTIDLGQLATELLLLGIDPYPRAPGAVFEAPAETPDPEEHPFAALKALKGSPVAAKGKKRKDN